MGKWGDSMCEAIRCARHSSALTCAFIALLCLGGFARADDAKTSDASSWDASSWHEIETKYIFGFTTGSGIGIEGEKEFTIDTHRPVRQARRSLRRDRDQVRVRIHAVPIRPDRIRRARIDPRHRRRDRSRRPHARWRSAAAFARIPLSRARAHLEQSAVGDAGVRADGAARSTRPAASACTITNSKPPSTPTSNC